MIALDLQSQSLIEKSVFSYSECDSDNILTTTGDSSVGRAFDCRCYRMVLGSIPGPRIALSRIFNMRLSVWNMVKSDENFDAGN